MVLTSLYIIPALDKQESKEIDSRLLTSGMTMG